MIGFIFVTVYFVGAFITCYIIEKNAPKDERRVSGHSAIVIFASILWIFWIIPFMIKIKVR